MPSAESVACRHTMRCAEFTPSTEVKAEVSVSAETLVTRIILSNSAVNPENTEVVSDHAVNSNIETVMPTARICDALEAFLSLAADIPATMSEGLLVRESDLPRALTRTGAAAAAQAMTSTRSTAESAPLAPGTRFSTSSSTRVTAASAEAVTTPALRRPTLPTRFSLAVERNTFTSG